MTTRLIVALVLLASSAHAATFEWANGFDTGTSGKQATVGTYAGGVSVTVPPVFRAQGETLATPDTNLYPNMAVSMPGIGNLGVIDLDTSTTAGASYGISYDATGVATGASQRTANTFVEVVLAPPPTCFGGGTLNGRTCSPYTDQNAGCGSTGVCRESRVPLVTHATATAAGCTIYVSQSCGTVDPISRVCNNPRPRLQGLYGGSYLTPGAGVCGSSRTMDDTPCGGPCSSASDCIQGRPDAVANDPVKSEPTKCVSDRNPLVDCDGAKRCAAGSNVGVTCTVDSQCPGSACQSACYCTNECDEVRKNEATCAPKYFMNANLIRGEAYAFAVEHQTLADPGAVQCRSYGGKFGQLCAGGANDGAKCTNNSECPSGSCLGVTAGVADDVPMAFSRGGGTQKVGTCTGGSTFAQGGRQRAACATTARVGTDPGCQCGCYGGPNAGAACTVDSQCPGGTCPGGCTAGTCSTTARITPDRVQWGWNDGTNPKARVLLDASFTQTGSSPVVNWRPEVVLANGESGLTTGWNSTGCGNVDWQCLATVPEPDGNTSFIYNQSTINLVHEWEFASVATTTLTPLGVALNVAGQDNVLANNDGAGVQLQAWDAGASHPSSPATFDMATFDFDDGNQGGYYPLPPVILTSQLGTLTSSEMDGWRGRVTKADAGHGLGDEVRITMADLEVFWQSPTPDPPNVLPGNKVGAVWGDSTSNHDAFYQVLAGLAVEPAAIYDGAHGGASMGDLIAAAPTLATGTGTARMPNRVIFGTGGQNVAFASVLITANTFNSLGGADPSNPLAYDGLLQAGHCESWTSGGGYTASQGKPCTCDDGEVSNWTSPNGNFVIRCLMKNNSFTLSTDEGYCLCSANAECSLGGASPSGASATSTTCSGGLCANNKAGGQKITAAAGTRTMTAPGCISASCPNGVCVRTNSVARALRGKRELEAIAAAAGTHLIWVTEPIPNGDAFVRSRPSVEIWNAALLKEQKAIGGDWIDFAQFFFDRCGPSILTKDAANPCYVDGVHYSPDGNELYATITNACWSNTTLNDVSGMPTDGVCTSGPTCTGSPLRCSTGLRQGVSCATNADCNYCSAGATGKLGRSCTANADCGYYNCNF